MAWQKPTLSGTAANPSVLCDERSEFVSTAVAAIRRCGTRTGQLTPARRGPCAPGCRGVGSTIVSAWSFWRGLGSVGKMSRMAVGEARFVWNHPARDWRALARYGEWQLRCVLRRPAVVPFALSGARFLCPAERRGPQKLLFTFRERYEPMLASLRNHVAKGDTVIDAGAHYGSYTVALGKLVGERGHVLAIEPASHSVDVLRRNVELNRLANVTVIQAALGDAEGTGVLALHSDPARNALEARPRGNQRSETVQITTLDAITQHRPVRFLKVDVEGAERSVLAGGSRLISQDRPTILVEHNDTSRHEHPSPAPDAWTFLSNLGYAMCRDNGTRLAEPPSGGVVNILAIPSGSKKPANFDDLIK